MITLSGYDNALGDARVISAPAAYFGEITIYNAGGADVTATLTAAGVLRWRGAGADHGFVLNAAAARRFNASVNAGRAYTITDAIFAMSTSFYNSETPIFFARIVNSLTAAPITSQDVDSIVFTLYRYTNNNIRSTAGSGYEPVTDWEAVALTAGDVIVDDPQDDPRAGFAPNFAYEPNTLLDNPFEISGNYRAIFTITPVEGNRIPVTIDFKVA